MLQRRVKGVDYHNVTNVLLDDNNVPVCTTDRLPHYDNEHYSSVRVTLFSTTDVI